MKTSMKLSLAAALVATLGTGAALADDQQLQNRLAHQRAEMDRSPRLQYHFNSKLQPSCAPAKRTTPIGVYAGERGVGDVRDDRGETRWEWRWNANGQRFLVAVPAR